MEIVDLSEEYEKTYLVCLEDWSDEMKEAGDHKGKWYDKMKEKGLGVKLAVDDNNTAIGILSLGKIE